MKVSFTKYEGWSKLCLYISHKNKTTQYRVEKIQVTVILQNSSYKTVIKGLYFLSEDQMCENYLYCGANRVIIEYNVSQYKF